MPSRDDSIVSPDTVTSGAVVVPVAAGDLIAGKYRLEGQIGTGGMGVVFAATHLHLDQQVALKFLLPEAAKNAEVVERFWREARAAVKIQSEHVARVMDIGMLDGGVPYIVMEYLQGDDLENIVKAQGPLPVAEAVRLVLHACEALAEAHAMGIVHRDIKPANLFLARRADGSRIVKLLDFGISKASPMWGEDGPRALTMTTAVIGSPRYMSPEQLRSSRDVDARSDVWALGVTLFELLGATSPFAKGTMPEVCASILKDEPQSLAGLRPEVPQGLELVIKKCLAKEPDQRWKNVGDLALALRPFGPLGIIDISIERIIGVLQQAASQTSSTSAGSGRQPSWPPISTKSAAVERGRETTPLPVTGEAGRAPTRPAPVESDDALLARLGGPRKVPKVTVDTAKVVALGLDHRAGFVLSLVDGSSSVEDLLDVSGMPRRDALRILCELVERRAIKV
jgi:eukaryotic-like serine/threonine-protein kinase